MSGSERAKEWREADATPSLAPDAVHVWRVALDVDDAHDRDARRVLSGDELDRCARFKFPHLRRRYAVARAALRRILARYICVEADALAFAYGPQGKPLIKQPHCDVQFNVSHSEDLALIAVGRGREVGVDLEHEELRRACRQIAARFFAPEEIAALEEWRDAAYVDGFYRCWTRKEAFIKACGGGLTIPLTSFAVSLDEPARLLRLDGSRDAAAWTLAAVDPAPGFAGCVAAYGPAAVSLWQWSAPCMVSASPSMPARDSSGTPSGPPSALS